MSNELQPFPTPRNRAERRASARRIAAAGSAAVLASAAGSAVVMFTGGPAGAAPTDVTTCADSGAGSLRAAVLYAEGHTGPDTITITASCTASGPVDVGSVMNVTDPLTIVGPGPDQFVLDGDLSTNFFAVAYNADFSVSGVTMQNGFGANGGAVSVANGNDLSFTNVVFRDNVGAYTGGAVTIKFSHDITITSSRFEDNQTYLNGGAVYLNDTSGDVVISNSTFSGNDAGGSGGAIFLLEQPGTLGIYNSTLTGNTAGVG